jgi:hypothetical protein
LAGKDYTHEFDIDYEDAQGKKYKGSFVVHRPTIGEKIKIDVLDSRLRQGEALGPASWNLTYSLATLMVVVDEAPKWFKTAPGQIYDYDLLSEIFTQYITWANQFFRPDKTEPAKTEEQHVSGQNVESDGSNGTGTE